MAEYQGLIQRLQGKIQGWSARKLSYAGRLCLVQSVLYSILRFWCSLIFIPMAVLNTVQSLCRDYLWSGDSAKKHYPIAWEQVCQPREKGGLDFKELLSWNKALLSAYITCLTQEPRSSDSLWMRWVRAHKLQNQSIWDCAKKDMDSAFWRDLLALRDELLNHMSRMQLKEASPNMVYDSLQGHFEDVTWSRWIWTK